MRSFAEIHEMAAEKKGSEAELEALLPQPEDAAALTAKPDDRWLSAMTCCVFQAGFNWRVIENKWDGFEEAFAGFDLGRCSMFSDEDIDALTRDTRIVRNPQKIVTVRANAVFLRDLAGEHGSAAKFFADWPVDDFIGLLDLMKSRGSRLGGRTAQIFLRRMGKDSFILSMDVCKALIREGVVDKEPKSKSQMRAVQDAFNQWRNESGRPVAQISRTLSATI